jgi:hypothetical protein
MRITGNFRIEAGNTTTSAVIGEERDVILAAILIGTEIEGISAAMMTTAATGIGTAVANLIPTEI